MSPSFAEAPAPISDRLREALSDQNTCTSFYVNKAATLNRFEAECTDTLKIKRNHVPKKGIYYPLWPDYIQSSDPNPEDPERRARDVMFAELNREANYALPPGAESKKFKWIEKVVEVSFLFFTPKPSRFSSPQKSENHASHSKL